MCSRLERIASHELTPLVTAAERAEQELSRMKLELAAATQVKVSTAPTTNPFASTSTTAPAESVSRHLACSPHWTCVHAIDEAPRLHSFSTKSSSSRTAARPSLCRSMILMISLLVRHTIVHGRLAAQCSPRSSPTSQSRPRFGSRRDFLLRSSESSTREGR